MIVVSGTLQVKPEMRDEAIAAMTTMQIATRDEAGCLVYTFYADLEKPGEFRVFEEWETIEHLHAHFVVPHMAIFQAAMKDLRGGAGDVKIYEIASVKGL